MFGRLPSQLSDAEFAKFQSLIERETGIYLPSSKRDFLLARLARRVHALGLESFARYWERVAADHEPFERMHMIDLICTNETQFFREPRHFTFLEKVAFPEFVRRAAQGRRPKRVRIWSAGCSTGEEPYSLAMILMRHFPPGSGWELSVVATDISTRALEIARRACYPPERTAKIPAELARIFVVSARDSTVDDGRTLTLVPAVLELVTFSNVNLVHAEAGVLGPFDLVFCRNVLIYFRPETRRLVVRRLIAQLQPDGHLVLGHAESLLSGAEGVRSVGPTIYARS